MRPSASKPLMIDDVTSINPKKQSSSPGFWRGFGRGFLMVVTLGCAGRKKTKPAPMNDLRYASCLTAEESNGTLQAKQQSPQQWQVAPPHKTRGATPSATSRTSDFSAMLNAPRSPSPTPRSVRRDSQSGSGWATQPRRASGRKFRSDAVGRSREQAGWDDTGSRRRSLHG